MSICPRHALARLAARVWLVTLFATVWMIVAPIALAHADLVNSSPAAGSEVASAPTEIRLVFSEAPVMAKLSVKLFDRRGGELEVGPPVADAQFATTIVVSIHGPLQPGAYTVVWATVSDADGHPESGQFAFGVEEPAGAPSVTADQLPPGPDPRVTTLATFLWLIGLTLLLGAAGQARLFGIERRALASLALVGLAAIAVGAMLPILAAPTASAVVTDTGASVDAGAVGRIAALILATVAVSVTRLGIAAAARRRAWAVALLAGLVLVWLNAASSHAAGVGILPWVSVAWHNVDLAITQRGLYPAFDVLFELARWFNVLVAAVHGTAVGLWIGGLLAVAVSGVRGPELAVWHPRFSRFAFRAFLVVAATGLYQAVLYLPNPAALVDSGYGRVLLAKHVFVAGVLVMAAFNRFIVEPALRRPDALLSGARRAAAAVQLEAAIGLGVIVVTAALATTSPGRPATAVFVRPDVVARIAAQPAVVSGEGATVRIERLSESQNRLSVQVPGGLGQPPMVRLILAGSDPRDVPLRSAGSDWVTEGLLFPRDGAWAVVIPLASGATATFAFDLRDGYAAPRDAAAATTWETAIVRTKAGMHSAHMIDELTDGLSVMLFGYHEFASPDRERFEIYGDFSSITADGRRFFRQAGASTWTSEPANAQPWPNFDFLRSAMGITIEGSASQDGAPVEVLTGYDPQTSVAYELWVGQADGMIHRVVMGLPGHYMVNAYFDVNGPVSISAPSPSP